MVEVFSEYIRKIKATSLFLYATLVLIAASSLFLLGINIGYFLYEAFT